jgi:hypothetical protein
MNTTQISRNGITTAWTVERDGERIGIVRPTATARFRASRIRGAAGNINRTANGFATVEAAIAWIGKAA